MKNFNGYIKVTNIPSFIEQIELKLSSKETLREVTKVGDEFWNHVETILSLDRDINSLVKLLAVAVNADLNKNELYVSFNDYYVVIEE